MYFHATHVANVESIYRTGLEPGRATGRAKRVWMCEEENMIWAIKHVCERHGWVREDIVIIPVEPRGIPLRRHGVRGLFWTTSHVEAASLAQCFRLETVPVPLIRLAQVGNHKDD